MIATQNVVWVIRDKTETEASGLLLPPDSREKPVTGTILFIGTMVKDPGIRKAQGKKAIFHKTVGQEIEYKGVIYLILEENHIIGVD